MNDPLAPIGEGGTAVPDNLRNQLIPSYIATLGELHAAEEDNIAAATFRRRPTTIQLLDDLYLRGLHRSMFDRVWRWAGRYRRHDVNIGGVDWPEVPALARDLVADTRAWVDSATYSPDEIGIRFHHRWVQIHPFVNGNGRHGRFAADYLVASLGRPRFRWGVGLQLERDELRLRYRQALQRMDADREDVAGLLAFARS